ncbi:sigma-70 family RNA polymerase sigma factor [Chloroflexi bacterium TSY]|nr:sigma-70 family RNA polymerase sigma factor [Chloroflexi bacterium TSY]
MTEASYSLQEKILLRRIVRHDQQALFQLYQWYGNLVYSLALRVLRNTHLAEEVTQDIFVKIWRHPEQWEPTRGQFRPWLLAITRNAAIDRLRKEQRQPLYHPVQVEEMDEVAVHPAIADDPHWYDGQLLREFLSQLPIEQRDLIDLAYFRGYTHCEMAQLLNLPLGTIKSRLRLGLEKLRTLWHKEDTVERAVDVSSLTEADALIPAYAIGATNRDEEELVESKYPECANATADLAAYEMMKACLLYSVPQRQAPTAVFNRIYRAVVPRVNKSPLPPRSRVRRPSSRMFRF